MKAIREKLQSRRSKNWSEKKTQPRIIKQQHYSSVEHSIISGEAATRNKCKNFNHKYPTKQNLTRNYPQRFGLGSLLLILFIRLIKPQRDRENNVNDHAHSSWCKNHQRCIQVIQVIGMPPSMSSLDGNL